MSIQNNESVPRCVRSYICIIASSSVLGLIIAACLGADISIGVSAVVGAFALHVSRYAFQNHN